MKSNQADFSIENHGSIFLFRMNSPAAVQWVAENVQRDAQFFGDALIVETSTIATVKGGAEVESVVRFLGEYGFALADIVGLRRRPLDNATAQLDLLFVPKEAAPRNDRRWTAMA